MLELYYITSGEKCLEYESNTLRHFSLEVMYYNPSIFQRIFQTEYKILEQYFSQEFPKKC